MQTKAVIISMIPVPGRRNDRLEGDAGSNFKDTSTSAEKRTSYSPTGFDNTENRGSSSGNSYCPRRYIDRNTHITTAL